MQRNQLRKLYQLQQQRQRESVLAKQESQFTALTYDIVMQAESLQSLTARLDDANFSSLQHCENQYNGQSRKLRGLMQELAALVQPGHEACYRKWGFFFFNAVRNVFVGNKQVLSLAQSINVSCGPVSTLAKFIDYFQQLFKLRKNQVVLSSKAKAQSSREEHIRQLISLYEVEGLHQPFTKVQLEHLSQSLRLRNKRAEASIVRYLSLRNNAKSQAKVRKLLVLRPEEHEIKHSKRSLHWTSKRWRGAKGMRSTAVGRREGSPLELSGALKRSLFFPRLHK